MKLIRKSISIMLVFIFLFQPAYAIISFSEINPFPWYNKIRPLDDDLPLITGD